MIINIPIWLLAIIIIIVVAVILLSRLEFGGMYDIITPLIGMFIIGVAVIFIIGILLGKFIF